MYNYGVYDFVDVTVMFRQSVYSVKENAGLVKPVLVLNKPSSVTITVQVNDVQRRATSEQICISNNYKLTLLQEMMTILLDHTLSLFLLV